MRHAQVVHWKHLVVCTHREAERSLEVWHRFACKRCSLASHCVWPHACTLYRYIKPTHALRVGLPCRFRAEVDAWSPPPELRRGESPLSQAEQKDYA